MTQAAHRRRVFRFGTFELDLQTGELHRQGVKVRLQEQPLRLLGLLIQKEGELVSREEIEAQLWPGDHFGDRDHRLNNAVNKIRLALGDSAENPRFLETIPRRGYRFTSPVHEVKQTGKGMAPPVHPSRRPWGIGVAAVLILAAALSLMSWLGSGVSSDASQEKILLAVLPFKNIGGEPSADYLSDGLTEEVILQLGRLSSSKLGIIARTSVMPYKTTEKGIRSIGEELGANYILEGSVRQEEEQLRITIQLIRVDQQTRMWAESYNRTMEDVFNLQRDVAERASASLALAVLPPGGGPASPTTSRAAHHAYLKARYFRDQGTEAGFYRAIDYFRLAIAEDPSYARAYAGLAGCQCLLAGHGLEVLPPDEAMPRAREMASKALGLDADLAEAQAVMGMVQLKYDWDFPGAERSFLRALELNPSYAEAHFWYSLYLEAMGQNEKAVLEARRARELNPISKGAAANLAMQLVNAGRYEEASVEINAALELDTEFWGTHLVSGYFHSRKGDHTQAVRALKNAVALSARNSVSLSSLGFTYAQAGRRSEAEALLQELQDLGKERYVSPAFIAVIHAGLGEKNQAFQWLEEAFRVRSRYLVWFKVAPEFESLRSDPRYEELLARIGLS